MPPDHVAPRDEVPRARKGQGLSGLRPRLLVLLLAAILPGFALAAWTSVEERRLARRSAESEMLRLSHLAADNEAALVEGTRQLLVALSRLPEVRRADPKGCTALFALLLQGYPHHANLGAITADGRVYCSALPISGSLYLGDRPYFRRAIESQNFAAGDYQVGRITHKSTLNFAYPVSNEAGAVAGVVYAALDLAWVNRLASEAKLPSDSAFVLLDAGGTVLARYPDPEAWIGKSAAESPFFKTLVALGGNGTAQARGMDGRERLYGFTSLGPAGGRSFAYVAVGIPTASVYAGLDRSLARNLVGLALLALAVITVAWAMTNLVLLRRLRGLVAASTELASGRVGVRTGLPYKRDEIGSLARAFDGMATALERRADDLHAAETKYRQLVERIPAVVYTAGLDGRRSTLYVSPQIAELLGFSAAEWTRDPMLWSKQIHDDHREAVLGELEASIRSGEPYELEYRLLTRGGRAVWVSDRGALVRDEREGPLHLLGVILDITDRKAAEEHLIHSALHDGLTGLPNRALFAEHLERAVAHGQRGDAYLFAVLFIDLDRFKLINDSLGHLVGDRLLVEMGRRILEALRPGDIAARFGGDEFALLVDDIPAPAEAVQMAERIQTALRPAVEILGHEVYTTASIGIAVSEPRYERAEDILRDADIAMYRAKSQGGARHALFDSSMHTQTVEIHRLETDLRRALARGELNLRIDYQPIVALETGRLAGFEALGRWIHPERGLIGPSEFIPLAEETGLIGPIGRRMLEEACRQLKRWHGMFTAAPPLSMSVNLSSKQLLQGDLAVVVAQVLAETGIDARTLALEITETTLIENAESAALTFVKLKEMEVRLQLDDFGTGYSSLGYLVRFPISSLKIDRSFVMGLTQAGEGEEIVRAIVTLAGELGMSVVAEGVETEEQAARLRALRCTYAQGFLYSRPLSAEAAEALIASAPRW